MPRAIIFDLDHTLYNQRDFVESAYEEIAVFCLDKYGVDKVAAKKRLLELWDENGSNYSRIFDDFFKDFGIDRNEALSKVLEIYYNHRAPLKLHNDAQYVLDKLQKKVKLGLITDGNATLQKNKIDSLKIAKYFDAIIMTGDYEGSFSKPHIRAYQDTLSKLKEDPNDVVYVGDNPFVDFIGAKKLGLKTIRLLRGEFKDASCDTTMDAEIKVKDLKEILNTL